jgi:predicted nucleotidyltransferase
MKLEPAYPTPEHQKAAEAITAYFVSNYKIDAVLLVNSCARGKATRDSCLDIVMLVNPDESRSRLKDLEVGWEEFESGHSKLVQSWQIFGRTPRLYQRCL